MSKNKKEIEIKQDDLKKQLKEITEKHNDAVQKRAAHDELAKRCLGAIEILQSLIQEEEVEDAEVRKEEQGKA